jgi:hypothetical protein
MKHKHKYVFSVSVSLVAVDAISWQGLFLPKFIAFGYGLGYSDLGVEYWYIFSASTKWI